MDRGSEPPASPEFDDRPLWRKAFDAWLSPAERRAVAAHIRALGWQRWVWTAGIAFHVPALYAVYTGASWTWVLGLWAFGVPLQPLLVWSVRRPRISDDAATLLTFGWSLVTMVLLALQSLELGGLESPYSLGVLCFAYSGALVADIRASRVFLTLGAWFVTWVVVLVGASPWFPKVSAQLPTLRAQVHLFGYWSFVGAVSIAAVHFGQQIASLRRELSVARRLARYRLQARIGTGGMNEVWLAWDGDARRNVALKILRGDASPAAVRRLQREARAMRALRSPHAVQVYEAGVSDDGLVFIAMEHLDGQDLERLVAQSGPLPPTRAVALVRQACAGLADAHALGIVHRDVKPSNLFLKRHPAGDLVKLIDFGIARHVAADDTRLTLDGDALGTPHFMAPEAFEGANLDARVDVYGLGATLYFLLTGRRPFEGRSGAALAAAVAAAEIPALSSYAPWSIPEELETAVHRALARDRDARFETVSGFDEALAAAQPGLRDAPAVAAVDAHIAVLSPVLSNEHTTTPTGR